MGPLPDRIAPEELLWTILSLFAAYSSARVWLWSRGDLRLVRASNRRHLARKFLDDVRNARWRLVLSLALTAAGVVAMTQPGETRRSPAGWIIIVLVFGAPIHAIWRNESERFSRSAILKDLARAARNHHPDEEES